MLDHVLGVSVSNYIVVSYPSTWILQHNCVLVLMLNILGVCICDCIGGAVIPLASTRNYVTEIYWSALLADAFCEFVISNTGVFSFVEV